MDALHKLTFFQGGSPISPCRWGSSPALAVVLTAVAGKVLPDQGLGGGGRVVVGGFDGGPASGRRIRKVVPAPTAAFDLDRPAVHLGDGRGDGQAEPRPALAVRPDLVHPVEPVEDERQVLLRDADARVADRVTTA